MYEAEDRKLTEDPPEADLSVDNVLGADRTDGKSEQVSVTLSLVSHTNVGKTTLARTLLRKDVGEVLDQAHVTEEAEVFELVSAEAVVLKLWDTPGFGDSARLLQRLRVHDRPVLWFFQQTWDRLTDRPLWSSQQAALNIRTEADLVLYLVNATEEPEEAGYVAPELELLDWLAVPVLVLLNQTGDLALRPDLLGERLNAWREHTARFAVVRDVSALDAFSRSWIQESRLLETIELHIGEELRPAMSRLRAAWDQRNLDIFDRSIELMGSYLGRAATERATLPSKRPSKAEKEQGMEALARRLSASSGDLMSALLLAHGLEGRVAEEIDRQLEFSVEGEEPLDTERGALLGGVVSGALGGLTADLLAGGLTFGGGLLAGAILGALGGAGLARGMQMVRGDRLPQVAWTAPFLSRLLEQTLLRYLAVAHFGRGRGEFRHHEASSFWIDVVAEEMRGTQAEWHELWKQLAKEGHDADSATRRVNPLLQQTLRAVLVRGYPEARDLLHTMPRNEPRDEP
ncbi:MAG: DUF3482 domain-containing protein [Thermoanaerobaculia bacterium]|nr:DUF3482 domain-containing protein [Thermoanaerobaculia bacterium]